MALLFNLYLGHLLGDFILQPGRLVAAKRRGLAGLLLHTFIIGGCTALILATELVSLWNIVLLISATHFAIEVITIRTRAVASLSGLSVFVIDQGLHLFSIVTVVWLAAPGAFDSNPLTFGLEVTLPQLVLICALLTVTFTGSIVVFEVVNVLGPPSRRRAILPFDRERALGMLERGGALLAATLVPPALGFHGPVAPVIILALAFLPRLLSARSRPQDERAYQSIVSVTGFVLTALGLAFVRGAMLLAAG